ncbi:DUF768 domain-containing protein [Methylocystis sp. H4A]|uniref:DUF768 domain-containing protein n=1 Tax=Methylocystis sp. H4A TaxID=2785788 RepID=UPI0018C2044E|nr:DUF768 domain-containing protein [Methylocystis sp. H4A]MBG0801381.1 DUF768 domain-containing protein [Methylocystis sp. H4A]
MSQRATDFIENWVANNIFAEGYEEEGTNAEAMRFAGLCATAAEARGIPRKELEEAAGDLVEHMADAIESANDAEVARQAGRDD